MTSMRSVDVPDETTYDPTMNAWLATGVHAIDAVDWLRSGTVIATDIETPGLDNPFTINCVTVSWLREDQAVHSILLDPSRNRGHAALLADIYDRASAIILHNACFDIPSLVHNGLMTLDQTRKVIDTLVLARFAYPDPFVRHHGTVRRVSMSLSGLAVDHLGWPNHKGGLELAFKAAGFKTQQAGYEGMDINAPTYRRGAMADTTATLLLEPILRDKCIEWTLDHPFTDFGSTTAEQAAATLGTQESVHRVMLRRSARGLAVDHDYLARYSENIDGERRQHELTLAQVGLEGGKGKEKDIVAYLDSIGELPAGWPTTPTGRLRATKADLDGLDHPIARAQRGLAATDQVLGYLGKVERQATATGRCHPQAGTLGASQTGRMSYSEPPLQQFSEGARPIITDDGQGLTSIDWSQIEPVTMALMAHDHDFLAPFLAGEDLYEPIMRAAGIDRKTAKVTLLQTMYGSGVNKLAETIGHTTESAAQIKRQMFAAMPACERFMSKIEDIGFQYGRIVTAGGRILPIDPDGIYKAVNYICQGSAYDVLAWTICEVDRQGMGDHIQLAMHDELVVDTPVAGEVQQIMSTMPPFLEHWAGRSITLRTDRADMGHQWLKV